MSTTSFPNQRGHTSEVDLLVGVTCAVVLAIIVIVLSPYALGLFKVLGLATIFYSVAKAVVQNERCDVQTVSTE